MYKPEEIADVVRESMENTDIEAKKCLMMKSNKMEYINCVEREEKFILNAYAGRHGGKLGIDINMLYKFLIDRPDKLDAYIKTLLINLMWYKSRCCDAMIKGNDQEFVDRLKDMLNAYN